MRNTSHGISIGIERVNKQFLMVLHASGKLTHADYEIITPLLESALEGVTQPSINVLADITELEGWELRAAWDDLKLGLRHGSEFKLIAIVGNKRWQEIAAKVGNWFISGEIQFFTDEQKAMHWLNE